MLSYFVLALLVFNAAAFSPSFQTRPSVIGSLSTFKASLSYQGTQCSLLGPELWNLNFIPSQSSITKYKVSVYCYMGGL